MLRPIDLLPHQRGVETSQLLPLTAHTDLPSPSPSPSRPTSHGSVPSSSLGQRQLRHGLAHNLFDSMPTTLIIQSFTVLYSSPPRDSHVHAQCSAAAEASGSLGINLDELHASYHLASSQRRQGGGGGGEEGKCSRAMELHHGSLIKVFNLFAQEEEEEAEEKNRYFIGISFCWIEETFSNVFDDIFSWKYEAFFV